MQVFFIKFLFLYNIYEKSAFYDFALDIFSFLVDTKEYGNKQTSILHPVRLFGIPVFIP